jgi:hypothetical protein
MAENTPAYSLLLYLKQSSLPAAFNMVNNFWIVVLRVSRYGSNLPFFVIKRTPMQLLSAFIGSQKIRLVGVGVSRLRERDKRQTLITDLTYRLS